MSDFDELLVTLRAFAQRFIDESEAKSRECGVAGASTEIIREGVAQQLLALLDKLPAPVTSPAFIDIVFDGPPGPESGRFIEVEDPDGKSISAGEWIDRGNGLWALRIARRS